MKTNKNKTRADNRMEQKKEVYIMDKNKNCYNAQSKNKNTNTAKNSNKNSNESKNTNKNTNTNSNTNGY